MTKCKYKLKPDALIWVSSLNIHVTNANMTDELAKIILEDSRQVKHFVKIAEPEQQATTKQAELKVKRQRRKV